MTITCFYQQAGINPEPEIQLVKLWENAWSKLGWAPVTLTEKDAMRHPLYDAMVEKSQSLPHVTDHYFQRYCFIRWLAFSQIGGVVSDYDVFPMRRFDFREEPYALTGSLSLLPGFVYAPLDWFPAFIDRLLNFQPDPKDTRWGVPHVCDQVVMENSGDLFRETRDYVRLLGDPGWREVPLVHFCNTRMNHRHQIVSALVG